MLHSAYEPHNISLNSKPNGFKSKYHLRTDILATKKNSIEEDEVNCDEPPKQIPKKFRLEDLEFQKRIGKGSFGIVKLANVKDKYYAVKCIDKKKI